MLRILGTPRRFCDDITRRDLLHAGVGLLGGAFGLPPLAGARAGTGKRGRARGVILLFLGGGAATQDMWDLKPDAPAEVRGEFKPVATNVPGVRICEHLPKTSRWMHRTAIVRSVSHKAGCHNFLPAYTGHALPGSVNPTAGDHPSMGSVCEYLRQQNSPAGDAGRLPGYVYMPFYLGWGTATRRSGPYAGFLGSQYDPLFTECVPHGDKGARAKSGYQPVPVRGRPALPNSALDPEITVDRLNARATLLQQIDKGLAGAAAPARAGYDREQRRALDVLTSAKVRAPFDLDAVAPKERDRYGRTLFGESTLVARRLVEAGVGFVNVTWDGIERVYLDVNAWDTHDHGFATLKGNHLPAFDQTYSALMEDLDRTGMLDETLVVVMSEMGRTPRVVGQGGRDHWTYCYSVVLAGGGIKGGTVYGASDAQAAYVKDDPVSPADVCATVYECLGIDPETIVYDRAGRPVPVALGGKPIRDILL